MMTSTRLNEFQIDCLPAHLIQFPVSDRAPDFAHQNPLRFAPIAYQAAFGGKQVYFSNPYQFGHYPVVFAYVDDGLRLQPTLLYYSQSHAIWRVAPAVSKKFGKGFGEFSCDVPPSLNMALIAQFNPMILAKQFSTMACDIESFIFAFTAPIKGYMEFSDQFEAQTNMPASDTGRIFKINKDEVRFSENSTLMLPYHLPESAVHANDLPDLNNITDSITIDNAFYKRHLIKGPLTIKSCLSYNEQYHYLFAETVTRNDEPLRFLLTIAPNPTTLNQFCASSMQVYLGYHHVTPIMRPASGINHVGIEHNHLTNDYELYLDVSAYAKQLPLNDFLNHPEKISALNPVAAHNPPASTSSVSTPDPLDQMMHDLAIPENHQQALHDVINHVKATQSVKSLYYILKTLCEAKQLEPVWSCSVLFVSSPYSSQSWAQIVGSIKNQTWHLIQSNPAAPNPEEAIHAIMILGTQRGFFKTTQSKNLERFLSYLSSTQTSDTPILKSRCG